MTLSHLDAEGRPSMVNVGGKQLSDRTAIARSIVRLPFDVTHALEEGDIRTQKGPVFETARLAGIMASKRTADLIPLCHPLPLDHVSIDIQMQADGRVFIDGTVRTTAKTGVEMEALTAVSVAALTVYDMCKALSHDIQIEATMLLEKTGGKRDFQRAAAPDAEEENA